MYLIRMKGEDIMNFWFLLICFGVAFLAQYALRSEERRVGKEC